MAPVKMIGKMSADAPLDRLEAVRVHGADGAVAATAIHTAELPGSMAWVSSALLVLRPILDSTCYALQQLWTDLRSHSPKFLLTGH